MKKIIFTLVLSICAENVVAQLFAVPFINDVETKAWNSPPDVLVQLGMADNWILDSIIFTTIDSLSSTDIYFRQKLTGPIAPPFYLDTLIQHSGTIPDSTMPGYCVRLLLGINNDTNYVLSSAIHTLDSMYIDKYASIDENGINLYEISLDKDILEVFFLDNNVHSVKFLDLTGRVLSSDQNRSPLQLSVVGIRGKQIILIIDDRYIEKIVLMQ